MSFEIKDKTAPKDSIKISPFRKNIRKTNPHKHNSYFEIVYLTGGKGTHTIDMQEFEIAPPICFVVRKEQVHFWNILSEPEGFVLIIKKAFIDSCLDREILQLVSKISAFPCIYPKPEGIVEQLFELLNDEYQTFGIENKAVIEGLLKALLAKLIRAEKHEELGKSEELSLFGQFKELLAQGNELTNNVAHYAELLHTSPQNLNAVCRKESNKSATDILSGFIISEAKRLLLYTGMSVTEIAYSLNFKDNSHFTKYFKRNTGVTPNFFRLAS